MAHITDKVTKDIATDVRLFVRNQKLKWTDISEWSTGEVKPDNDTEVSFPLPMEPGYRYAGVWVTIPKALDKRPKTEG